MAGLKLLLLAAVATLASRCSALQRIPQPARRASSASSNDSIGSDALEVVQAVTPPRSSFDGYSCRQVLLEHDFANSYGTPYVGLYSPPPTDCAFTTTIFNLSVSSRGQQYDRLAQLFLGDVEVWRTSTAMPTEAGIHWNVQKDMSIFDALLRGGGGGGGEQEEEKKIILDLGNVVDGDLYTGVFSVTLEALYYNDAYDAAAGGFHPADHIYPISNLSSAANKSSVFSLPDDTGAVALALPRTARTAVVSLLASGNAAEEFWYTNVPSEWLDTFGHDDDSLYGYGAFREVQLLVDGRLAGAAWPFPVLFTGGVDPGLWRPVVGIGAFDLPSFEVDVTPWLPLLCDGELHTLGIRVVGFDGAAADGLGTVGQNWWVTGAVFVWLDENVDQAAVAGAVISTDVSAPVFDYVPLLSTSVIGNGSIVNESLWVSLSARRTLSISSSISTGNGTQTVCWTQDLSFSNVLNVSNAAWDASLVMEISGSYSGFFSGGQESRYSYPLNLYYSYYIAETEAELSSVFSVIDRSLLASGVPTLPYLTGTSLRAEDVATRQNITSNYYWNETIVGGIEELDSSDGETWFSSSNSPGGEFGVVEYSRYMVEKDDSITTDDEAWETIDVPATQPLPKFQ